MDTKALRQKILDLAIRGKLVPQDPNDEPASVLLERIRAEKERLIAEGKIKRPQKSKAADTTSTPEQPHFAIPTSWQWVKLGEIGKWQSGSTPSRSNKSYYGGTIPWLKTGDLNDGLIKNIPEHITYKALDDTSVKLNPTDSILIAMYGATIGKIGILTFPATTNQACCACSEYDKFVERDWLFYFLLSNRENFISKGGGGAQSNISKDIIVSTLMPLPPKEEQNRIVEKVEELFALIDEIERGKTKLSEFIGQAKSKILSLAIQGKLVEQDPTDEPAADLLKRINPDWKPSDPSQYPNLPQGWTECRLEDVVDYEQPQRYIVASTDYSDKYPTPVLTAGKSFIIGYTNEAEGIFSNVPVIIFDDFTTDSKLVDFPFKVKSSAMKILHVKNGVDIRFIYYLMSTTRLVGKTHKRYWISEYSKMPVQLPPLNEQRRIVEKIEALFKVLDDIQSALQP